MTIEHMRIPIDKDSDIKGFKLGQKVRVVVEGTIDLLEAEREFDDGDTFPPEIGVKVAGVKLSARNKFSDMVEEEEGDD